MSKGTKKIILKGLKRLTTFICLGCVLLNTFIYTYAEPESNSKLEILHFTPLEENIQKQNVVAGTILSDLNLPSVLNVELLINPESTPASSEPAQVESQSEEPSSSLQPDTSIENNTEEPQSIPTAEPIVDTPVTASYMAEIDGVEWISEPAYNGNSVGQYIFTPVLPSNYVIHPDAILPNIEINVFAAPVVETPQILVTDADPENNSDVLFYFIDSYDSYQWQKLISTTWENIEGQTHAQLRLTKEEFYATAYRCILVKNGSEFNSAEINFGDLNAQTNRGRAATLFEESDYLKWYATSRTTSFDIQGKDNGVYIKTTFSNLGYETVAKVNESIIKFGTTKSDVSLGSGLYADVDLKLVSGGRYLQITYIVRNTGTTTQSFQIGSNADVMINKNDRAPIKGAGLGRLTMTDGENYQFNLIAPEVSTLWYGSYSARSSNNYANMFGKADMSSGAVFLGDSGLAYSWDASIAAGQTWKKSALIGVGKLAESPKFIVEPTLSTTQTSVKAAVDISGTLESDSNCTVYAALDNGAEFEIYKGAAQAFSGTITIPENISSGPSNIRIWAISDDGGTSQFYTRTITIAAPAKITLTTDSIDILEDTVISDYTAYFKKYVSSYIGTVTVDKGSFSADIPGADQQVIITADNYGATASAILKVNVIALPLKMEQNSPTRVDSTNNFNLSATIHNTGPDKIIETGFVWGIMQNPTIEFNNGSSKTATPVTTKRGSINIAVPEIAEGVVYYARPYVKTASTIYYGEQKQFDIGGKSYGSFGIAYTSSSSGISTFTITRTGGTDGKQIVYYRTVNGSAIGGTHFTAKSDKIEFAEGETSKTIMVLNENVTGKWGSKVATQYSAANRKYWVEIYRVEGGADISTNASIAERTLQYNGMYYVRTADYIEKPMSMSIQFAPKDIEYANKYKIDFNETGVSKITINPYSNYNDNPYIQETCAAYGTRILVAMSLPANEKNVIGHVLFSTSKATNKTGVLAPSDKAFDLQIDGVGSFFYTGFMKTIPSNHTINIPAMNSSSEIITNENSSPGKKTNFTKLNNNTDINYLISEKDNSIYGIIAGTINQKTTYNKLIAVPMVTAPHTIPYDVIEPQVLGIAPFSTSTYKPGDKINVSIVFDEVVSNTYSLNIDKVQIKTNYGIMDYKGGVDTNILYFEGTVPNDAPETIILSGIVNPEYIKDFCNINVDSEKSGFTGSPSASITVNNNVPLVQISEQKIVNGKASAKINASNYDSLKYTFTADKTMPVTGWVSTSNASTVSIGQPASYGKQYLHIMATYNETGAMDYEVVEFDFGTAENPTSPIPLLTLSTDNNQWSTNRVIHVTRIPSNAVVTYVGPQSGTVSGNTVTVTQNGTYTFTLIVNGESFSQSINVTNIDTLAPEIKITGTAAGNYSTAIGVNVDLLDKGESEIKTITAEWKAADGTSQPVSLSNTGGTLISPATTGVWKLSVTVVDNAGNTTTVESPQFNIIVEQPVIVINQISTSTTGDVYTYTVTPPSGATISEVTLPDGTKNQDLTGTFTLKQPGTYYVTAADNFGHLVKSNPMVVAANVDGEAPEIRLSTSTDDWTQSLTVNVSLFDNNEPISAEYKKKDEVNATSLSLSVDTEAQAGNSFKLSNFAVSENGTYTVSAKDAANNVSTVDITIANIDTEAPTITLSNPADSWTSTSQEITVVYKDNDGGSGIASAQYAIVASNTGTKPQALNLMPASGEIITVNSEGANYIYYKLTDNAGLVTDGYTDVIKVDTVTPALTVTTVNNSSSVDFSASAEYGESGGDITLTVDGVNTPITNGSYQALKKGKYIFAATSLAGLSSTNTTDIYNVSFDSNGGTVINSELVISGAKITTPTAPTKQGYQFKEWQKNGGSFNFKDTAIVEDTNLNAIWILDLPTVTIHADKTNADYTGNKVVTLTANVSHTLSTLNYEYVWFKNGIQINGETARTLEIKDVNQSGSYTVKVKAKDGTLSSEEVESSSLNITINKAIPQISVAPNASDLIYGQTLADSELLGGKALYSTTSLIQNIVNLFTAENEISGSFSWTQGTILPTFADSEKTKYSVTFIPDDTNNIATATVEITVSVAKKELTPSVNAVSDKTYDGDIDAEGTLILVGAVNNESPKASGNFSFSTADAGSDKTININQITLDEGWDDNYVLTKTSLNDVVSHAKINPLPVVLTWKDWENLTYNGEAVNVTAEVINLVGDDVCTVGVSGGTPTLAGQYTANATSLSNMNYTLLSSVNSKGFVINKAPVSFDVSENEYEYDGHTKGALVLQKPGQQQLPNNAFTYHYEQLGIEIASPVDKGQYDIIVTLNNNNFMHKDKSAEERSNKVGTLEILGKPYPGSEELNWPSAQDLIYGQTLKDSELTGENLSTEGTYSWKDETLIPKVNNTGNYVVFTPNNTNYATVEKIISINVMPKQVSIINLKAQNREFKPEDKTITVTDGQIDGIVGTDNVELDYSAVTAVVDNADAAIQKDVQIDGFTIKGEDKECYVLREQPTGIKVDITPTTGSATVELDNWVYGEQASSPNTQSPTNTGASIAYIYEGTGNDGNVYSSDVPPTNAGSYTIKALVEATQNYKKVEVSTSFEIEKRTATIEWSNLVHTFNGSSASPSVVVKGLASTDTSDDCSIAVKDYNGNSEVGKYNINTTVTGNKTFNYNLVGKNTEILTIVPAPVSVVVSDLLHNVDGIEKKATVTLTPNVAHTVSYRTRTGEVSSITTAGSYDVYVTLNNDNYRFENETDGSSRKFASMILYENTPPELYTVSFDGGATDAIGTAPSLAPAQAGEKILLPYNTFTSGNNAFAGWEYNGIIYQPHDLVNQPANNEAVFIAQWTPLSYQLGGTVYHEQLPVSGAKLELMRGSEKVAQTYSLANGKYNFSDVLPGTYNLVATKAVDINGEIIQTIMVELTAQNIQDANIDLPSGKTNSVLEVLPGAPKIITSNLGESFDVQDGTVYTNEDKEKVLNGGEVEIKLTVQRLEKEDILEEELSALQGAVSNTQLTVFMDLGVQKKVVDSMGVTSYTPVQQTDVMLEMQIPLPIDMQGKHSYSVIRMHNGDVDVITQEKNANGEYIVVNADKTVVTLYSMKFSTYVLAYSDKEKEPSNNINPMLPNTEFESEARSKNTTRFKQSTVGKKDTDITVEDEISNSNDVMVDNSKEKPSEISNESSTQNEGKGNFNLLNALFAIISVGFTLITLRKKKDKRAIAVSVSSSIIAIAMLLTTSGYSGIGIVDIWCIPIALFAAISVASNFIKFDTK